MSKTNGYTPTQRRMLDVLSDGLPHRKEELHACLNDDLQPITGIKAHLTILRKILRPLGQDIICQDFGHYKGYRLMGLLTINKSV